MPVQTNLSLLYYGAYTAMNRSAYDSRFAASRAHYASVVGGKIYNGSTMRILKGLKNLSGLAYPVLRREIIHSLGFREIRFYLPFR